jgi:D-arabinose 1-dehydrogenase-like Zn-dependent alcohol dehydrogenase
LLAKHISFLLCRVKGHPSGGPLDCEQTIQFALAKGVKSMNEVIPFKDAQKAYDGMMAGKPRFRYVLKM